MPLQPDHAEPAVWLLTDDAGTPVAQFRFRDDDGIRIAGRFRALPGAAVDTIAAQAGRDLAGSRLETADDDLAGALVAAGATRRRAATDLRHRLTDLPPPVALPAGWSLGEPGWDADLLDALASAYGPEHPESWDDEDTRLVREMFDDGAPVPPLTPASARVVGPDGRSAGHVLCAGPVPWTDDGCAWVLNLAVAPRAQRRGLGWALVVHALHGSVAAGLPALGLEVADGNPARRMYDRAGFVPRARVLSVDVPSAA